MKLLGSGGSCYGVFSSDSMRHIHALGMQYPARIREVPEIDHVNSATVKALLEFQEGRHILPTYGELTHQVLCADALGDDLFIQYISRKFKITPGRINGSNKTAHIRMALRDRMKLAMTVEKPSLTVLCMQDRIFKRRIDITQSLLWSYLTPQLPT